MAESELRELGLHCGPHCGAQRYGPHLVVKHCGRCHEERLIPMQWRPDHPVSVGTPRPSIFDGIQSG